MGVLPKEHKRASQDLPKAGTKDLDHSRDILSGEDSKEVP